MLQNLTDVTLVQIAKWMAPHSTDADAPVLHPRRVTQYAQAHVTDSGSDLADRATSLLVRAIEIVPLTVTPDASDPHGLRASCLFGIECVKRFLAGNDRLLPPELYETDFLAALVRHVDIDGQPNGPLILDAIRPMLPNDSWFEGDCVDQPCTGLTALVLAPRTGLSQGDRGWVQALVDAATDALLRLGFRVTRPTDHEPGVNCTAECSADRNFDLAIVINTHPSTRVGHQLKEVADHLGATIVLTPMARRDTTCLFKRANYGLIVSKRFDGTTAAAAIKSRDLALALVELLNERSVMDAELRNRSSAEYHDFRRRVLKALAGTGPLTTQRLIPEPTIRRVIASINSYQSASLKLIAAIEWYLAIDISSAALEPVDMDQYFREAQLAELDRLIENGGVRAAHRARLLSEAARDLIAGRNTDIGDGMHARRYRTYENLDDWLGLARDVFPDEYGR